MTIINGIEIDDIEYHENEIKKAINHNDPIEEKLHVITVFSNPCNYATRYILMREFIRRMKDEMNIILYVVELAYENQEYHVTESDNPEHLRLRINQTPLWHKENLINIGVKQLLPNTWKAFAWIDADIEFDNPHWALDTLKILNGCKDIVQLFSNTLFMDKNKDTEHIFTGLAYQYVKRMKRSNDIKDINSYWHPGFAWACTRKLYDKIGGLYEYAITGDGDLQMASCFLANHRAALPIDVSCDYKRTLRDFERKVSNFRLGYIPGIIRHHYHGSISSRKYCVREKILTKYNYSPTIHLTKDENGLLIPTNLFPEDLKQCIYEHFQSKQEDNHLTKIVDIKEILESKLGKQLNKNCIVINLEKDTNRLNSSINEFKKLSIDIDNLTIFNATYWKNTRTLENDLNSILNFIKVFNNKITNKDIKINDFSETNDTNIGIQDAPLACYCSHVRAMIHGYSNFEEYTIITEDDISIDNVNNIEKYINLIPNDWDIICFNSIPKEANDNPFHKLKNTFYNLHFYIIRNACFETLFQNLYPINDQIDILVGNLHNKLNIYNIRESISQKHFITNIQNNLHVIYHAPAYIELVRELKLLDEVCLMYVNSKLGDNNLQVNKNITNKIIDDVIFTNIFNALEIPVVKANTTGNDKDLYKQLNKIVKYFIKDEKNSQYTSKLIDDIDHILNSFILHNKVSDKYDGVFKAYNFGCSSSVYLLDNIIVKVYNDSLRWTTLNHDNIDKIYKREINILKKIDRVLDFDGKSTLIMKYYGESLYNEFWLPNDWEEQIQKLFQELTNKDIYYPEFNLNNIVVKNNIITFVDFGLAEIRFNADNNNNCTVFIELLTKLNNKFINVIEKKERNLLYYKFMNNLRRNEMYSLNVF
jgi:hypothetical protein